MSSSFAIAMPSEHIIKEFCATNNVPSARIAKLAFAIVLHQYFDHSEFLCSDLPQTENDNGARAGAAKRQRVEYFPELACTTSIRTALSFKEANSPLENHSKTLLFNHQNTTSLENGPSTNGQLANLIISKTGISSIDPSIPTISQDHSSLFLQVNFSEVSQSARVFYSINQVSEFVATGFAEAFATTIQSITSSPLDTVIASLDICGVKSREVISSWNQFSTNVPNKLLHQLVGSGFVHKPDATAIVSWDGEMSYSELDKRSSSLAAYLMDTYDLNPGKKVALCFEKCTWAIVCMLAVLKTGAAYCCLDPSHPRARHDTIIQTLNASVVIASIKYEKHLHGHRVLVPDVDLVSQTRNYQPSNVQPNDVCMVAFTSGSTGNPKGIVHTHNSLVTGITSNARPQHLDREGVSTFQWSSYTFDVSMIEIYAPLIYGGRVCIPSDEERINNVEESMNRMAVNWAYFTPSFARLFAQYKIPSLQTLLMGGEVVTPDDINAWNDHVRVIHSYGPAESATFFLAEIKGPCPKIVPIGPAPNTYSWVVNPNNAELLTPLGAIGEMLYEGPGLLKEYLGDPEKTKKVLIEPPAWRKDHKVPAPSSKLYKSGDLVRYLPDGNLMYIGRKDTMVKVRGQRLEVEEVESVIRKSLGGSSQAAVDLVELNGSGPRLVAYLRYSECGEPNGDSTGGSSSTQQLGLIHDEKISGLIAKVRTTLTETLPGYMVPRIFIPMAKLPTNSNGKLDRGKLKEFAKSLSTSDLLRYMENESNGEVVTDIPEDDTVALEVSEILDSILRKPDSTEENSLKGKNASLENLGLDSLRIVSFARSINQHYGLNVPIKTFRKADLNVRDIAEIVRSRDQEAPQYGDHARTAGILQDIDNLYKKELSQVQARQSILSKTKRIGDRKVVFLTGATGFLGSQILRQLLAMTSVSKVIVLVRAKDAGAAFQRIVAAATTARWWSPSLASRIEVWLGDLAQPQLGLSKEQWARLEGTCSSESEAVTSIIHNGAVVNWSSSYERLRATNVLSTVELLRLALAGDGVLQDFTYVSGGEMHLSEKAVADDPLRLSSADGYSQSKFASDILVDRCVPRALAGQRINMVKPGIIIGTATEGISNTDDYIWRLVAGACEAGAYVDGEQDAVICLAGADHVAERIIHSCLGSSCNNASAPRALRMTEGVRVSEFWTAVSEGTGLKLQAMDFEQWLKMINLNVSQKGPSHLLWPVMEWVEQRKGRVGDPRLTLCKASSCSGHCPDPSSTDSKGIPAVECQQDIDTRDKTLRALHKSVEYLSSLGFLQGETTLSSERQDIFRRSGVSS